jgi:hypothetical protein
VSVTVTVVTDTRTRAAELHPAYSLQEVMQLLNDGLAAGASVPLLRSDGDRRVTLTFHPPASEPLRQVLITTGLTDDERRTLILQVDGPPEEDGA